jgi:SAM-dependent methyltransferase
MSTFVTGEVDSRARTLDPAEERVEKGIVVCDERENGPVVILVRVHVEHVGARRERLPQCLYGRGIAPLREVRHGFERQLHARTLGAVQTYYDRRAPEYDDWWLGKGLYGDRDRPGWEDALRELEQVTAALPPCKTLDVACGTGFLTRHLQGDVVGLDASSRMLVEAKRQAPHAEFVQGDALELPFPGGAFERVFASYFYCHLEEPERERFLAEARRVASELVVVGSHWNGRDARERWEERELKDGSRWTVYKRVFVPEELAAELGGGEVVHVSRYFVVVRA